MRCTLGLRLNEDGFFGQRLRRQRAQRRDVVDDPDAAPVRRDHQIVIARVNDQVAHRDVGQFAALVLRPLACRHRAKSRGPCSVPTNSSSRLTKVLSDDVRVTAHRTVLRRNQRRPRLAEVRGLVHVRAHVAERVQVESGVGRARFEMARVYVRDPRVLRQALEYLPMTLVQVLPPSRVICTLPSSVPTQMTFGFFGDSAIE